MSVGYQSLISRIGVFFFFGCLLMILGAVGEWIVGNTFPFVVFGSFGKFTTGDHNRRTTGMGTNTDN